MSSGRDPLGKRALFSGAQSADEAPKAHKRGALDVTVICSSCEERTILSAPDFVRHHLPFGAWLPWRKHSHLMKCPACGKVTWHAGSLVW